MMKISPVCQSSSTRFQAIIQRNGRAAERADGVTPSSYIGGRHSIMRLCERVRALSPRVVVRFGS